MKTQLKKWWPWLTLLLVLLGMALIGWHWYPYLLCTTGRYKVEYDAIVVHKERGTVRAVGLGFGEDSDQDGSAWIYWLDGVRWRAIEVATNSGSIVLPLTLQATVLKGKGYLLDEVWMGNGQRGPKWVHAKTVYQLSEKGLEFIKETNKKVGDCRCEGCLKIFDGR